MQILKVRKSEVEGEMGMTTNGYGVSFGGNEDVLELVMSLQFCEYTKPH